MSTQSPTVASGRTAVTRGQGDTPATSRPAAHASIPFVRLLKVELVKMFNTRSGVWLVASIGILSTLATLGVLLFGSLETITYDSFATAVGLPTAIILPILGLLTITSEFSQRTGLTTFTMVPSRSRVVAAKLVVAVGVGVVAILVACGIGALGNLLGAAVNGISPIWEFGVADLSMVVLANVLGMLMGFALGVLVRNTPAAVVGYFVYSLVLPNVFGALAFYQEWFHDIWPWVDFFYSTTSLYEGVPSAEGWAQLAVSGGVWMLLPLLLGVRLMLRSEIK